MDAITGKRRGKEDRNYAGSVAKKKKKNEEEEGREGKMEKASARVTTKERISLGRTEENVGDAVYFNMILRSRWQKEIWMKISKRRK